jgi:hypothetical protein
VKERDAAAAAIDAEVLAGVVLPPMQTQIQCMGGMSSAVVGGFCEHNSVVHELVAKFADMAAKETAKEHGWQLKEATVYQRHHIRQRLATGAWRDFHENKIARLPYVDPSTEYARKLRHLQASGVEKCLEARSNPLFLLMLATRCWGPPNQRRTSLETRAGGPPARWSMP